MGLTQWFEAIAVSPPESVGLVPIPISGRVAISIIGVPRLDADLEALRVLGETMGRQLEKVIKMAKARSLPPEDQRVPPVPASVAARVKKNDTSQFPFAEAESDVSVETGHASEVDVRKDRTMEAKRPRPVLSKFPFREVDDEEPDEAVAAPNSTQRITSAELKSIHEEPAAQEDDAAAPAPASETARESSVAWAISEGDIVPSEFEPVSPKLDDGSVAALPPDPPAAPPVDEDDVPQEHEAADQPDAEEVPQPVMSDEQIAAMAVLDRSADDLPVVGSQEDDQEASPADPQEDDEEELDDDDVVPISPPGLPSEVSEAVQAASPAVDASNDDVESATLRGIRMPRADDDSEVERAPEPADSGGAGATSFGLPLSQVSARITPKTDASSTVFGLPLMSPDDSAESPVDPAQVIPAPSVVVSDAASGEPALPEQQTADVEPPAGEAPTAEEPAAEEPAAQEPAAEEPAPEEQAAQEPVAEEPAVEEPAADTPEALQGSASEPAQTPDTIIGVRPNEIGDERSGSSRTLMGGIEANLDLAGFAKPASVNETLRGGFDGIEPAPVEEQHRSSVNETLRGGIEPVLPEPPPQEDNASFVPGALILKRAKVKRKADRATVETPIAPSPVSASAPKAPITPVRHAGGQTLEIGREKSNSTLIGMRAGNVKDVIAKSDEWFDELGDTGSDAPAQPQAPASRVALDDDPRTIPPEALERILESQPLDIEVQEAFLLLDDRNRNVAFEAADVVASAGPAVLEGLAAMFPGRLFVDRYQHTFETMPPVAEHGPVLHVLVRLGEDALPVCRSS
ncbi:MAG: hypothetical protein R3E66_23350 [bacterium]